MQIEIIREEPVTLPVKEVVLHLSVEEARTIHGLLEGKNWYSTDLLPSGEKNRMQSELRSALMNGGVPVYGPGNESN